MCGSGPGKKVPTERRSRGGRGPSCNKRVWAGVGGEGATEIARRGGRPEAVVAAKEFAALPLTTLLKAQFRLPGGD